MGSFKLVFQYKIEMIKMDTDDSKVQYNLFQRKPYYFSNSFSWRKNKLLFFRTRNIGLGTPCLFFRELSLYRHLLSGPRDQANVSLYRTRKQELPNMIFVQFLSRSGTIAESSVMGSLPTVIGLIHAQFQSLEVCQTC